MSGFSELGAVTMDLVSGCEVHACVISRRQRLVLILLYGVVSLIGVRRFLRQSRTSVRISYGLS